MIRTTKVWSKGIKKQRNLISYLGSKGRSRSEKGNSAESDLHLYCLGMTLTKYSQFIGRLMIISGCSDLHVSRYVSTAIWGREREREIGWPGLLFDSSTVHTLLVQIIYMQKHGVWLFYCCFFSRHFLFLSGFRFPCFWCHCTGTYVHLSTQDLCASIVDSRTTVPGWSISTERYGCIY